MLSKPELRLRVRHQLNDVVRGINLALEGKRIQPLVPVLARIGRGAQLPHWYEQLSTQGTLPNLDGKTIGSVVEMLLVGVLETQTFAANEIPSLGVNPARGVDLPDLDLGVKAPSENFCTSEPFFSAYERLLGSEYDVVVLLTDYQTAKRNPPLRLQIRNAKYLSASEVADFNLCNIARKHRDYLIEKNESWAKKIIRFLAFVNQSDWQAKQIIKLISALGDDTAVRAIIERSRSDFLRSNQAALLVDKVPIPDDDLAALTSILNTHPTELGIVDVADNWVIKEWKDAGRFPSENEWRRIRESPLNGKIGMSFALQWRYNFGQLFRNNRNP